MSARNTPEPPEQSVESAEPPQQLHLDLKSSYVGLFQAPLDPSLLLKEHQQTLKQKLATHNIESLRPVSKEGIDLVVSSLAQFGITTCVALHDLRYRTMINVHIEQSRMSCHTGARS